MTNQKYKIMLRVHNSTPAHPVSRSDFYKRTRDINRSKRAIDELIEDKLLKMETGSDKLIITKSGITELEKDIEKRQDLRRATFHFWITTLVALLAFAVSLIALLSQLGMLQISAP